MSPEQASGERARIGPATDVYGLGAVLYHALTGRPPFDGASAMNVLAALLRHPPVPPSRLRPDLPRDLEAIVLRCLAKVPADRPASAGALADALDALDASLAGARPSPPRARAASAALGAAAVALVVVVAVALVARGRAAPPGALPPASAPTPSTPPPTPAAPATPTSLAPSGVSTIVLERLELRADPGALDVFDAHGHTGTIGRLGRLALVDPAAGEIEATALERPKGNEASVINHMVNVSNLGWVQALAAFGAGEGARGRQRLDDLGAAKDERGEVFWLRVDQDWFALRGALREAVAAITVARGRARFETTGDPRDLATYMVDGPLNQDPRLARRWGLAAAWLDGKDTDAQRVAAVLAGGQPGRPSPRSRARRARGAGSRPTAGTTSPRPRAAGATSTAPSRPGSTPGWACCARPSRGPPDAGGAGRAVPPRARARARRHGRRVRGAATRRRASRSRSRCPRCARRSSDLSDPRPRRSRPRPWSRRPRAWRRRPGGGAR